jgi:LytS/YehU family sensor histidine kinase
MENMMEGLVVLLSWKILATSIAIYAIISLVKRLMPILNDRLIENKLFKIILTSLNLILGLLIAIHPTFLPGSTFFERMIAGIVAGFLSSYFYQFVKRFFENKRID